jgi:hypothetical protein
MDSGPAGEYWLADFVGEDEDWVSKYLQGIHFVNEESDDIGGGLYADGKYHQRRRFVHSYFDLTYDYYNPACYSSTKFRKNSI